MSITSLDNNLQGIEVEVSAELIKDSPASWRGKSLQSGYNGTITVCHDLRTVKQTSNTSVTHFLAKRSSGKQLLNRPHMKGMAICLSQRVNECV